LHDSDRHGRYAGILGSQWPVTELLRVERLGVGTSEFGDVDIFSKRP